METKIVKVNPKDIKLLDVNARYMKADEFKQLVENIKRDGVLSSVPFCCYDEDWNIEVLSGNHRVQAAVEAGLEEIDIMLTEQELTKNEKIAIALSHNSICGQDDMAILKQMYEAIDDVEMKAYCGLDDETLEMLDKVSSQSMSGINLEYQVLNIAILPTELKEAKKMIEQMKKEVGKNETLILRYEDYDKWLDTLDDVGSATNIKNTATTLLAMLDVVNSHMDELKDVWINEENEKQWVPTSTLLGRTTVKINDGKIIDKAITKLIDKGEIDKKKKEKAFAYLAQFYLDNVKSKKDKKK